MKVDKEVIKTMRTYYAIEILESLFKFMLVVDATLLVIYLLMF